MRTFVSAILLLLVCGSSGDGDKTCLADHYGLVPQSISGSTTKHIQLTRHNGTTILNTTTPLTDFTEKIDYEYYNSHTTTSFSKDVINLFTNETVTMKVNETRIFHLAQRHAIAYVEVNDPLTGNINKTCVMAALPDTFPDVTAFKNIFKTIILPQVQQQFKCGGNDGTYDTWKSEEHNVSIPEDFPGMMTGSARREVTMTQDSLFHSSDNTVKGFVRMNASEGWNSTWTAIGEMSTYMRVSSAEVGGPSAADLDPMQFDVECTQAPEGFNTDAFPSGPVFQKHLLVVLQAVQRQQLKLAVV